MARPSFIFTKEQLFDFLDRLDFDSDEFRIKHDHLEQKSYNTEGTFIWVKVYDLRRA